MCIERGYPIQIAEKDIKVYRIHYLNKKIMKEMSLFMGVHIRDILNNKPEYVSVIERNSSYVHNNKQKHVFNNNDNIGFHSFKYLEDACNTVIEVMRYKLEYSTNLRQQVVNNEKKLFKNDYLYEYSKPNEFLFS